MNRLPNLTSAKSEILSNLVKIDYISISVVIVTTEFDFPIKIPGGAAQTAAALTTPSLPTSYRICGRFFNTMAAAIANDASVCSKDFSITEL